MTNKNFILEDIKFQINFIEKLDLDDKVDVINKIKLMLHEVSPMKSEPVDCVIWVKNTTVEANDYNPNSVAPPEMELLRRSIEADGYTQPIVTMEKETSREVIDGFHRNRVGKECKEIQARVKGYLPVVTIKKECEGLNDRMASTIRHNRARGKHQVDAMSDIVLDLKKRNWSDKKISKELGMDQDEVLRLYQISGVIEAFQNSDFSQAWEVGEYEEREESI